MTIRLGLDGSLRVAACAISTDDREVSTFTLAHPTEGFSHGISRVLRLCDLDLSDIQEIVVCVGPGSYMGVRTAVTTANALGLALSRPVTGVLSVDALAVQAPRDASTSVAVPAGRGRWFAAQYSWEGDTLTRTAPAELVDEVGRDVWRASEPGQVRDNELAMIAEGVLRVARSQVQLAPEIKQLQVEPRLPTTFLGSQT